MCAFIDRPAAVLPRHLRKLLKVAALVNCIPSLMLFVPVPALSWVLPVPVCCNKGRLRLKSWPHEVHGGRLWHNSRDCLSRSENNI